MHSLFVPPPRLKEIMAQDGSGHEGMGGPGYYKGITKES